MKSEPRRKAVFSRRALLLGLLAVAVVVLIVKWNEVALAYRLNAAQQALRNRDWDAALTILEQEQQRGQTSPQWHYLRACSLRRAGQSAKAETSLTRATALGWNPADIDRQRLLIMAASGRIQQVEPQLTALIARSDDDQAAEEIYEAMARGYLATFHVDDAKQCLEFWSAWQSDNPLPHLWLADLYVRLHYEELAIDEYRKVLAIKPAHHRARLELAKLLLKKLNLEESQRLFEAALADEPDEADALLGLAEIRQRQGAGDEAHSLLYDALVLDLSPSQRSAALATLGQRDVEDRQYVRAAYHLERSIALNPHVVAPHLALASALAGLGQHQRADAEREIVRNIRLRETRLIQAFTRLNAEPKNPDPRCEAGLILMEQGMLGPGADWLKTALILDPNHRAANEGLAAYYDRVGNASAARQHRLIAERAKASMPAGPNP